MSYRNMISREGAEALIPGANRAEQDNQEDEPMADEETNPDAADQTKAADKKGPTPPDSVASEQVDGSGSDIAEDVIAGEEEQGYRGIAADPTPNEHYTLQGVAAGLPTPETDPAMAAKAHEALRTAGLTGPEQDALNGGKGSDNNKGKK